MLGLVALVSLSSCGRTLYEGAIRPPAEAAVVRSLDTEIDEVDGKDVRSMRSGDTRYVLPPGPHVIGMSLRQIRQGIGLKTVATSRTLRVCLLAAAGHDYIAEPRVGRNTWAPLVLDVSAHGPAPVDCTRERLLAPTADAAPAAPAQAPGADDGASPAAAPLAPADGSPEAAVMKLWAGDAMQPPSPRPFVELTLGTAASFGGDNILTATLSTGEQRTLSAGQGVSGSLGAMVTPMWFADDRFGLGVGGEIGIKYAAVSASNGNVSFKRYPAIATVNAFARTGERWFLLASGGVEKDLGVNLSGDGVASNVQADLTSRAGWLGRLGAYYRFSDGLATTFGLGYTKLTYDAAGGAVGANSFGVWWNVQLPLVR
jgi:hypothetical protein